MGTITEYPGDITNQERGLVPFQPFEPGQPSPETPAPYLGGEREQIEARIKRILWMTDPLVAAQVKADFHANPELPAKKLETTVWKTEQQRLIYLRYYVECRQSHKGGRLDDETLLLHMVDYEARRQYPQSQFPAVAQDARNVEKVGEWLVKDDVDAYNEFVRQLQHITGMLERETQLRRAGAILDTRSHPGVFHARTPLDPVAKELRWLLNKLAPVASVIADFLPIVGQLKGAAEAIGGRDIFTGEKLPKWRRVVGGLIAVLPFGKGIFSAGQAGLRKLAVAGALTMRQARDLTPLDIYRMAKVAGSASEKELRLAWAPAVGKITDPAQRRAVETVAGYIDEMNGIRSLGNRTAAGTLVNGRSVSRSISSAPKVKPPGFAPGKPVQPTKIWKSKANDLTSAGIEVAAIAAMERASVYFTKAMMNALRTPEAVQFVNKFFKSPGFESVLKDLVANGGKHFDGAQFVMRYAVQKDLKAHLVKFELPAGITHRHGWIKPGRTNVTGASTEVSARRVDIVIARESLVRPGAALNVELKSWTKETLELALRPKVRQPGAPPPSPSQLVKDTAIFGRENIRWVFDAKKLAASGVTRDQVIAAFKKAIQRDPYLKAKWPQNEQQLESALGKIIEIF